MWIPQEQWIETLSNDGVYVNQEYHSTQALREEVAYVALRGVEGRQYHEAILHIHLPKRNYYISEKDSVLWLMYRNAKWQEKRIEALGYQASTENTLEREIVTIIKGMNDDIFPEHDAVKTLRDMIIRIAGDPRMRTSLWKLKSRAKEVDTRLWKVDEKRLNWKLKELTPEFLERSEELSKQLFWDFMEITKWTETELWSIHWLSWAWKLPETYGKLKHMAWCWVLIACVFSLVE